MTYLIEQVAKNILPKTQKYPFDVMVPGSEDSFLVPCLPEDVDIEQNRVRANAKNQGMRLSIKKCEGGFRVWRTK